MSAIRLLLLKLALRACERGDTDGAAEALRGLLALERTPATPPASTPERAVSATAFARLCGYTAKHVRKLVARGQIPAAAVIGRGRGRRILVDAALEALRGSVTPNPPVLDEIEREGAEYVRRRGRLRVVTGEEPDS